MTIQNGTIRAVTLISGNPNGAQSNVGGTNYSRKAYAVFADFPAYTGSTDSATITGILTAIAAAVRNGATLTLRAVVPHVAGQDSAAQAVHFGGTSVQAATLSNTTTTGDAAGNLVDASDTELTATTGTSVGVGVIAIVDES
jgi:hypothetical protein